MKSYILCSTPRTGSTLLCDLLIATKRCGAPDSFFMRGMDPQWLTQWGMPTEGDRDDPGYCAAMLTGAVAAGKGGTDIFGLRLMWETLPDLTAMIDNVYPGHRTDRGKLAAAFGDVLYIHLKRENKLAQAVSMVKAEQSGLWHVAPDGREIERLAPPSDPIYDYDRIAKKLAELNAFDAAWADWFTAQEITPLAIGYETLSRNPADSAARICDALGVPAPAPGTLKPGTAKLADAINRDWIDRFRKDAGL